MTLSFPANPTNGQQYTDPNGKVWEFDSVKWNVTTSSGSKQFSGVKIELTSAYSLSDTESPISFDSKVYDTGNYFSVLTPSIITIPRAGYYRVKTNIQTGTTGEGASYSIQLLQSGLSIFTANMAANQSGVYDEILTLNAGETIQLNAGETAGVGTLAIGTVIEVYLIGYTFGGAITPGFEFSGVRVDLFNDVAMSNTPTPITWSVNDITYDLNANAAGNTYWSNLDATKFTVSTTGYYRVNAYFLTSELGSENSYTIDVRKNGTTLESGSVGPSAVVQLDETYNFTSGDYLQIYVDNSGGVGDIKAPDTSISLTRLGV